MHKLHTIKKMKWDQLVQLPLQKVTLLRVNFVEGETLPTTIEESNAFHLPLQ